jgi:molybdate transport repressor ModE-like protein
MRVELEPVWKLQSLTVDPVLLPLLDAIERLGSLAAAANEVGFSYRHVWSLLAKWEESLGRPLAHLERGRGTKLTPLGTKLVQLQQQARQQLGPRLADMAREFEAELAEAGEKRALRVCASHDLALARLPQLAKAGRLSLELEFHGSIENLDMLVRGACDLAGFHVAEQARTPEIGRRLNPRAHTLIGVALREQGLMMAPGNPRKIQGLPDLARGDLRLVNRQRGSGTRLVFDQLLANAGIRRNGIGSYQIEEFTHLAVAAAVAGGIADVGFGIRAAAAELGLGFIPLVNERYFLACRTERLANNETKTLLSLLRGKAFRALLASMPGYDDAVTGRVLSVEEGLAGPRPAKRSPAA